MYKIMYRPNDSKEWQCIGSSTDQEVALEDMDKLEKGPLGKKGSFKLIRGSESKMKLCKECVAECSGSGKEGNGNQCSYHTTEENMKRKVKILEITCCGECPSYNPDKDHCTRGAEIEGEDFFEDCPLEEV